MSLVQEGYLFKRGGPPELPANLTVVRTRGFRQFSLTFQSHEKLQMWRPAKHASWSRCYVLLFLGRGSFVKVALHEAGDVVKRWNLRYFMLLAGSQPTLVYYRKVSGEACWLSVKELNRRYH